MNIPYTAHTLPDPQNTIIFEIDTIARREPRLMSAYQYLVDVKRYCHNGVGEALVTKIEFRKSTGSPQHEFLLCYVKDRNVPERKVFIRLERFNDNTSSGRENKPPLPLPATELLSLDALHSSSPSSFGKARDTLTITCDINVKDSDTVLSTLTFDDDSDFTFDEAAMMCKIASDCANEYSVVSHQCFWYAGVIYKIVQETYMGRVEEMTGEDNRRRGKGKGVRIVSREVANRFIPRCHTSEVLAEIHAKQWSEWAGDIEAAKEEEKRKNEQYQQECDRKDEEIARLRKALQAQRGGSCATY
ncbi:uncharacterized protein EV420DRAFT_1644815 [Desarmillaria tabescens]|uniref:Uncharacterized protein n=1 Tax=Armillaria tabescens TaxID=1929756 RepID=A0AA39K5Y1_ARMTA|nr:uncharacterized protein EV420DRAFT_1644815 [Desarmillaria tabescens]KAK0455166.1 hypothetical protein EV420DRAFT_1644815 [Desarmillaria tabescens]